MENKLCKVSKNKSGYIRKGIVVLEDKIRKLPDAKFGNDCAPLTHKFAEGMYIRQITMPKGMLLTSKIHLTKHPYFVLKGDVSVLTEKGVIRIKAPFSSITEPGTKRVLYMHEETVWITVHASKETNVPTLEKLLVVDTYDELPEYLKKECPDIDENALLTFQNECKEVLL